MDIIIIGAGHGGLQAAKVLAENGLNVTVYEEDAFEELSYDWRDDVERTVFEELNIPVPEGSYKGAPVSLVAPFSDKPLLVWSDEEKRDWNIDRRQFAQQLARAAENGGATVRYHSSVESLIVDDERVKGVRVRGEEKFADLVIDASGMSSPFRASLPEEWRVTKQLKPEEAFTVYRAFYKAEENAPPPEKHKKKIYLKYMGRQGIAWCSYEPDGEVNVLIGSVGELEKDDIPNTLRQMKNDNPILSDTIVRGGQIAKIPVRYPLTKMVGNGYAAVGDSAFMTIPLIGSGIANSLRAGQMLAERIIVDQSVSVETLWKYQVEYYHRIGAGHFIVDCLKRMLLQADNDDIRYMFECGILTDEDMVALSSGEALKLTPKTVLRKLSKGAKKSGFIVRLVRAALKGVRAKNIAMKIPTGYDERRILKWQAKLERIID